MWYSVTRVRQAEQPRVWLFCFGLIEPAEKSLELRSAPPMVLKNATWPTRRAESRSRIKNKGRFGTNSRSRALMRSSRLGGRFSRSVKPRRVPHVIRGVRRVGSVSRRERILRLSFARR